MYGTQKVLRFFFSKKKILKTTNIKTVESWKNEWYHDNGRIAYM